MENILKYLAKLSNMISISTWMSTDKRKYAEKQT